jgi:2-polyprenyl-3-methyl-5-hydroxy-6-metoxy-1,4-benzoquinol methylase
MVNKNVSFPGLLDPITREPLKYCEQNGQQFLQSETGSRYKVMLGIPRIVESLSNYTDAFGLQWKKWTKTQLDSFTGTTITKSRIEKCLGKELHEMLSSSKETLNVLEFGCGAGRFTEILLQYNVRLVSADLSSAVEANAENCPVSINHQIVQADILNSPFGPSYDVVICLGVIQHTPNSEAAIDALYSMVKPGGHLVIDHYTYDLKRFTKLVLAFRPLIKRLPARYRIRLCEQLVSLFLPIHKLIRNIPFAQAIFSRISPITSYYHAYPELSDESQRAWAVLDTHDGLTDWNKSIRSLSSIKKTLFKLKAKNVEVWKGGNGVEARCVKPE